MKSSAFLLRTTPMKNNAVMAAAFSETSGRISLLIFPTRYLHPSPFCLIDYESSLHKDDLIVARDVEIIDSFSEMRDHPEIVRGASLLAKIVETCIPYQTPSRDIWQLFIAFFQELPSFSDWKVAPFLFALRFFEQEGLSPETITTLPSLSEETRHFAKGLFESPEETWKTITLPQELLDAVLEMIGVCNNQG